MKVLGILALVIAIKRSSTLVETILRKLISKYYKDEWSRENMDNLQENVSTHIRIISTKKQFASLKYFEESFSKLLFMCIEPTVALIKES